MDNELRNLRRLYRENPAHPEHRDRYVAALERSVGLREEGPIPSLSSSFSTSEEAKAGWAYLDEAAEVRTKGALMAFMTKLEGESLDYGTVTYAMAACALAATTVFDNGPNGGITGFQAGFVMWAFIQRFTMEDGPMTLIKWRNMIYPQYQDKFANPKEIDRDLYEEIVDHARQTLEASGINMHERVMTHMVEVAAGRLPWGYTVKQEGDSHPGPQWTPGSTTEMP